MSVDERVILLESGFDARSRGVNGSRGRAASREARGKVADYDVRSGTSWSPVLVRHSAGLGDLEWWRHLPPGDATGKPKGVEGGKKKKKGPAWPAGAVQSATCGALCAANHKKDHNSDLIFFSPVTPAKPSCGVDAVSVVSQRAPPHGDKQLPAVTTSLRFW